MLMVYELSPQATITAHLHGNLISVLSGFFLTAHLCDKGRDLEQMADPRPKPNLIYYCPANPVAYHYVLPNW